MTSKWSIYDGQISELLKEDKDGSVEIAKQVLQTSDSWRSNKDIDSLSRYIRRSAKRLLDTHEGIFTTSDSVDVSYENIDRYWDKSDPKKSVLIVNPHRKSKTEEVEKEIDFTAIYKDLVTPVKVSPPQAKTDGLFDRLIFSDVHVGMEVNKTGFAMYGGKWDEEELMERLDKMVAWTLLNQKCDVLHIHDLGDFMDGFNGETTRGGHKLPQNMDNQKAFDTGLRFKVRLIDSLINHYSKIVCVNITNDNHGGAFTYMVNSAFKAFIELKYENVQVDNQREFMKHYIADNKAFVLCHGKDEQHLKFGFKPQIDDKQIKKISDYIDRFIPFGIPVEFSKGDSHYWLYDYSASRKFSYKNFPSFAPPSDWVKTNFNDSISGFSFENHWENGQISDNNYVFN